MKKIKQFFLNILYGFFSHKEYNKVYDINNILGHPNIVKQAKAADKMFREMERQHRELRIHRAKQKEHILRQRFGKDVDNKNFYDRKDVIDFIMTSHYFNEPQSKSGNYYSGSKHSNDDYHSHSTSSSSCGSSGSDD